MDGNVFIVGLGLIGGSLALTIKAQHPHATIYGYDIKQSEIDKANTLQIIDEKVNSIRQGAELADLIILSAPVLETEKLMKHLVNMKLKENVIITDTGSTKGGVMNLSKVFWERGITFIGGHPMAGSHKAGVESAKAHLFENAFYVLTPHLNTSSEEIDELKQWLNGADSHFLVLDPEEHDNVTGVISHFPHIVAAGLVNQAKKYADKNPLVSLLAAGGFRDITRIASSSPTMWKDIVKQNRHNLLDLIDDWIEEMNNIKSVLLEDNEQTIAHFFEEAKTFRDSLPVRSKGAIPSYYDLYVDVMDTTGAIASITSILAEQAISITNLHIIESREGLLGVLRISFQKDEDRSKAQILLKTNDYKTYEAA